MASSFDRMRATRAFDASRMEEFTIDAYSSYIARFRACSGLVGALQPKELHDQVSDALQQGREQGAIDALTLRFLSKVVQVDSRYCCGLSLYNCLSACRRAVGYTAMLDHRVQLQVACENGALIDTRSGLRCNREAKQAGLLLQ